jgi:hypothetical protein
MSDNGAFEQIVLPGLVGAVLGGMWGRPPEYNRASHVIGGVAAGIAVGQVVAAATDTRPAPAAVVALPASVLGTIAYDRWLEGMWPFR